LTLRAASLIGGGVLAAFAVVLSLSIADAFFNIKGFSLNLGGLGGFFADAYGILAFAIPLYLFCNAFLLFEPVYHPSRMFILLCCIIPFLTLAISGEINRNFDAVAENSDFLATIGRFGFVCIVLFVIILETIFIVFLTGLLFSGTQPKNESNNNKDNFRTVRRRPVRPRTPPARILPLLPIIKSPNPEEAEKESLRPKRAEYHAEYHDEESVGLDFPELKPLSSREAFRDFEATVSKSNEDFKRVYTPTRRSPSAYVDIPEPFERDPREITDGAERGEEGRRAKPAARYAPSAYADIPEPFERDPREITDGAEREEEARRSKPAARYAPSAYVDIPEPFERDPREITDGTDGAERGEEGRRSKPAARYAPSAYADIPEPFERDPREITDGAERGEEGRRPKPAARYAPSAYADIPEPFERDPREITDEMERREEGRRPKPAARHAPSAYADIPEPFERDPREITDEAEREARPAPPLRAESLDAGRYVPADDSESPPLRATPLDAMRYTLSDAPGPPSLRATSLDSARHRGESAVVRQPRKWRNYHIPVLGILNDYPDGQYWIVDDATLAAAETLKNTLSEFKIQAEVTGIRKGPVITMFEILPAPGVKLSRIVNLQDNIALRLAAASVRIVAPIPGKHAVGIETPNAKRNIVSFAEIIECDINSDNEGKHMGIPVVLGKDITGEAQTIDLTQMPHLLIAGATGSGKSVCVNAMILSILYRRSPNEVRLILIDPKIVELKLYNDIPHLLTPVITEPKKAFQALQYCVCEMERRYACLDSMGVRDVKSYNKRIRERNIATEHMPYIVVVIDEFADLMVTTGKDLESTVARLAAMSRAVGIHLVLATQRPSIDVITGLIKANIPSRIAFMVASKTDSRIIIDVVGAEKLLGKGDMLYSGVVDPFPVRMQGAFVSEEEVERLVDYVKTLGTPDYIDDEIFFEDDESVEQEVFTEGEDPLYERAWEIVTQQGKASASFIQRKLKIGYNRAARLVEEMEARGLVGPAKGSKPRDLLRGV
jgi:S-DNA-T family DNA segregation ATPase FtsK/SpoIIIE